MGKIDCLKCAHWREGHFGCEYEFRWASNAAGGEVNHMEDVWRCPDYDDKTEDEYDG